MTNYGIFLFVLMTIYIIIVVWWTRKIIICDIKSAERKIEIRYTNIVEQIDVEEVDEQ